MIDVKVNRKITSRTLILKRLDLLLDEKLCTLISFADVTDTQKVKEQEETDRFKHTLSL